MMTDSLWLYFLPIPTNSLEFLCPIQLYEWVHVGFCASGEKSIFLSVGLGINGGD